MDNLEESCLLYPLPSKKWKKWKPEKIKNSAAFLLDSIEKDFRSKYWAFDLFFMATRNPDKQIDTEIYLKEITEHARVAAERASLAIKMLKYNQKRREGNVLGRFFRYYLRRYRNSVL